MVQPLRNLRKPVSAINGDYYRMRLVHMCEG